MKNLRVHSEVWKNGDYNEASFAVGPNPGFWWKMISIRLANESHVAALGALDLVARNEDQRREFVKRSVASGDCFVAVADDEVIGYGVLNYTFYNNGYC